jgi:phosphatidylinositol glycan class Q protein
MIAVVLDIYSFFTFHVLCFHSAAARIYNLQLSMLYSLWLLFRGLDVVFFIFLGKKYNPLRKRIDSFEYNVDQLLLGTFLFTVNIFLLPTTGIYYLCFSSLRLFVLVIKASLILISEVISSFPFYSLALYFLHKDMFSGGVWLEILSVNTQTAIRKNMNTTCFYLRVRLS